MNFLILISLLVMPCQEWPNLTKQERAEVLREAISIYLPQQEEKIQKCLAERAESRLVHMGISARCSTSREIQAEEFFIKLTQGLLESCQ